MWKGCESFFSIIEKAFPNSPFTEWSWNSSDAYRWTVWMVDRSDQENDDSKKSALNGEFSPQKKIGLRCSQVFFLRFPAPRLWDCWPPQGWPWCLVYTLAGPKNCFFQHPAWMAGWWGKTSSLGRNVGCISPFVALILFFFGGFLYYVVGTRIINVRYGEDCLGSQKERRSFLSFLEWSSRDRRV